MCAHGSKQQCAPPTPPGIKTGTTHARTIAAYLPQLLWIVRVLLSKLGGHEVVNPAHHPPLLRGDFWDVVLGGLRKASQRAQFKTPERRTGRERTRGGLHTALYG